jgi:hypothetical protein
MIWGFIFLFVMALLIVWTLYALIEYDERQSLKPNYEPTDLRLSLQNLKTQFNLLKAMLKEKFKGKNEKENPKSKADE